MTADTPLADLGRHSFQLPGSAAQRRATWRVRRRSARRNGWPVQSAQPHTWRVTIGSSATIHTQRPSSGAPALRCPPRRDRNGRRDGRGTQCAKLPAAERGAAQRWSCTSATLVLLDDRAAPEGALVGIGGVRAASGRVTARRRWPDGRALAPRPLAAGRGSAERPGCVKILR